MKLKKIIGLGLAFALSLTALTGCEKAEGNTGSNGNSSNSDSQELRKLRVGIMTTSADQYAVYIGTEEGIFEKYGIEVETNEFVAGINTVDAIVNGLEDTGLLADFAAVNRIGNTLNATNLVLFSELNVSAPTSGGLYVAPQYADDLSSLDGSAGWITNIGTVSEYYNWQAQTYVGLDPAKQNIVQTDSNQTSLALAQTGNASAVVAYGANGKYYEDVGWTLAANAEDIGIRVGSYLVTTREFLADNTELLADYIKALKESVDYITNNLDSSAERVEEKFGVKAEDFKLTWQAHIFQIGFTEEGAVQLDNLNDWAYGQGKYDEEYNIRDFIDTSAVEIAVPENVTIIK